MDRSRDDRGTLAAGRRTLRERRRRNNQRRRNKPNQNANSKHES
jgi:hypothetical protein